MRIYHSLSGFELHQDTCVTLGVFDGIHIGHQRLLRKAVDFARSRQLLSIALTFDLHPEVIINGVAPPLLSTTEEKLEFFRNFGIQMAVVAPFNHTLAQTSARDFVQRILLAKLKAKIIVIGLESTFGQGAHGNTASLTAMGEALGFQVEVVEQVMLDKIVVSSTAIREALLAGKMENAMKMLGRPYEISGPVIAGEGRGRKLGFPTANLAVPETKAIPPDGIYAGLAQIIGESGKTSLPEQKRESETDHLSVIYIGRRPTFAGQERVIEAHIMAPQESALELYGKSLRLAFISRLREDRSFSGEAELTAQMKIDAQQAASIVQDYYTQQ
jgi:riboflavin kinase / FMN adenylyltransferase